MTHSDVYKEWLSKPSARKFRKYKVTLKVINCALNYARIVHYRDFVHQCYQESKETCVGCLRIAQFTNMQTDYNFLAFVLSFFFFFIRLCLNSLYIRNRVCLKYILSTKTINISFKWLRSSLEYSRSN